MTTTGDNCLDAHRGQDVSAMSWYSTGVKPGTLVVGHVYERVAPVESGVRITHGVEIRSGRVAHAGILPTNGKAGHGEHLHLDEDGSRVGHTGAEVLDGCPSASCSEIQGFGLRQDLVAEVAAEEARRVEVHLPAEDRRELRLHREEAEAGHEAGLELHQDVHVAFRREVVPQDRSEERQAPDVVAPAECCDRLGVDGEPGCHDRILASAPLRPALAQEPTTLRSIQRSRYKHDHGVVMNKIPVRDPASSLSLKEAAVLSGVTERSIRHELSSQVIRAGKTAAGSRRFAPRELLYFCLVAELPIELSRKDRRDLFDLLARGAERQGRWRRESQRLVLEGGVPVILPISDLVKRVEARVALFERGRARVVSRADTLSGEPVFRGTRISVRFVGGRAAREPTADILQDGAGAHRGHPAGLPGARRGGRRVRQDVRCAWSAPGTPEAAPVPSW